MDIVYIIIKKRPRVSMAAIPLFILSLPILNFVIKFIIGIPSNARIREMMI